MAILILILIGFTAGTLGSLLGLGGGFLIVPALILLKGWDDRLASGTAVAVIVPTMLITLWRRGIQGHIEWGTAGQIAVGAVAGAFLGSWLAGVLPAALIRRTFAVVLLGLAALLFFKEPDPVPGSTRPDDAASALGAPER